MKTGSKSKVKVSPNNIGRVVELLSVKVDDRCADQFAKLEEALYLGRLDEAEQLIKELPKDGLSSKAIAVRALLVGDYKYQRGQYGEAETEFQAARYLFISPYAADSFGEARTWLGSSLVARRRNDFQQAIDLARKALEITGAHPRKEKFTCLNAIALFNLGGLLELQGDLKGAEESLSAAVKTLRDVEGLRYYALALNSLSLVQIYRGKYKAAISTLKATEELAQSETILDEVLWLRYNNALALMRLKKYQEARAALTELLDVVRKSANDPREPLILQLLGEIAFEQKNFGDAMSNIDTSLELASSWGNDYLLCEGLVLKGRLLAKRNQHNAQNYLQRAYQIASSMNDGRHQAEAALLLASIISLSNPDKAMQYLSTGSSLVKFHPDIRLIEMQRQVEKELKGANIIVDENQFLIRTSNLPTWRDAKHAVEMFLLRAALNQTDHSVTKSAKLLKVSKATVTEKRKEYHL